MVSWISRASGFREEEHPAGAQAQQLGDLVERPGEQRRQVHRGIDRPRHVVEDGELTAPGLSILHGGPATAMDCH
jgi:hypothetical protein